MSSACLTPLPPARTKFIEECRDRGKKLQHYAPTEIRAQQKLEIIIERAKGGEWEIKSLPFVHGVLYSVLRTLSLSLLLSLCGERTKCRVTGDLGANTVEDPFPKHTRRQTKRGTREGTEKKRVPLSLTQLLRCCGLLRKGGTVCVCVCAYEVWCNSPSRPTRSISWFIFRSEFILFLLKDFPTVTGVFIGFTKRRGEHNCSLRGGGLLAALRSRSTSTRRHHGPWMENCIYTCCRSHRTRQHGTE